MPAYLVVRVNVTDPVKYEAYKKLTPAAIAGAGGRFIARGGPTETLEGPEETHRVVLVEFPDMATARAFYDSPPYREARAARAGGADMQIVLVDGN